ncbi:MAG: hypothetical protein J3K34DRAFT_436822 [Monoraphidium minutum]|nr:MAG: hypothetical protein J3K34DRAFT_436822 [Monoraphidium minutum]
MGRGMMAEGGCCTGRRSVAQARLARCQGVGGLEEGAQAGLVCGEARQQVLQRRGGGARPPGRDPRALLGGDAAPHGAWRAQGGAQAALAGFQHHRGQGGNGRGAVPQTQTGTNPKPQNTPAGWGSPPGCSGQQHCGMIWAAQWGDWGEGALFTWPWPQPLARPWAAAPWARRASACQQLPPRRRS